MNSRVARVKAQEERCRFQESDLRFYITFYPFNASDEFRIKLCVAIDALVTLRINKCSAFGHYHFIYSTSNIDSSNNDLG